MAGAEPPPKRRQRITAFPLAHVENRSAFEVHDDGYVLVPLAGGNLVDGDLLDVFQPRLGEPPVKEFLLDFFDHVPTNAHMAGHVLDGHMSRQIQDIAFKRLGVGPSRLGKANGRLANGSAVLARQPGNSPFQLDPLVSDRHRTKPPHNHPLPPNVLRATGRTATGLHLALDRKDHTPCSILRSHVTVVTNPKPMVQQARGHVGISRLKSLAKLQIGPTCPHHFKSTYASPG